MKNKLKIFMIILTLVCINSSCVKEKIAYAEDNLIYGTITYNHITHGSLPLLPGQHVQVFYNGVESSLYSFNTTDSGRYQFSPFAKGEYALQFNFTDSLLQYDATLVEKADVDTLRENTSNVITYEGSSSNIKVDDDNKTFQQNIILQQSETGLRLRLMDDKNNLLPNVRVCIYSNESFASKNAPYCGGCLAYLSSDKKGEVIFTGLQAQSYYINARAEIGLQNITNQWAGAVKSTDALQKGQILLVDIVLK